MSNQILEQILGAARAALAGSRGVLSRGEQLAAALVLNRPDWLAAGGDTIAEAIDRVGPEWMRYIPEAARQLQREIAQQRQAAEDAAAALDWSRMASAGGADDESPEIFCNARLQTYSEAPGYRTISLYVEAAPVGETAFSPLRLCLGFNAADTDDIGRYILEIQRHAWSRIGGPLDQRDGETRPRWIGP